jgi:hypothetical protein
MCLGGSQSQSHIATDGLSVNPSWCRAPSGAHDQILGTVEQLRVCPCGAPSLTRGRVCHLVWGESCGSPSIDGRWVGGEGAIAWNREEGCFPCLFSKAEVIQNIIKFLRWKVESSLWFSERTTIIQRENQSREFHRILLWENVHKLFFGLRYTGNVIILQNTETGVFSQAWHLLCRIWRHKFIRTVLESVADWGLFHCVWL